MSVNLGDVEDERLLQSNELAEDNPLVGSSSDIDVHAMSNSPETAALGSPGTWAIACLLMQHLSR
jgi:hypothetical protein